MRPPYVDPNTNIIYDTDNAEYEGWLTKQSTWMKVGSDVTVICGADAASTLPTALAH